MRLRFRAATAALALVVAAPLGAVTTIVGNLVTVSFDDDPNGASPPGPFGHGRIITNEYTQGNGVIPANSWLGFTVIASKSKAEIDLSAPTTFASGIPHFAVLYNSGRTTSGADPDLERDPSAESRNDWDGGNLVGQNLGNLLIIQENAPTLSEWNNRQLTGVADNAQAPNPTAPDDNANGGRIRFDFDASITQFAWNWADLDDPAGTYIRFVDTKTGVFAQIDFRQFSDAPAGNPADGDYYERLGVDWAEFGPGNGDGYANSFTAVTIAEIAGSAGQPDSAFRDENGNTAGVLLNTTRGWRKLIDSSAAAAPASFDQVEFVFAGSGGLALIAFEVVPEPSTYAALAGAAALVGVVIVRRRRR